MRNNHACLGRQELQSFQELINYSFRNVKLLEEALTHKSFVYERSNEKSCLRACPSEEARRQATPGQTGHNQRLEFLGDALLGMVVSEYLYRRFPQQLEGNLSKMKSLMVNGTLLVHKAKGIRLGEYLLLGKGEEATGGRDRTSLLADSFEALIGSIYLDGGLEACRCFILDRLRPELEGLELEEVGKKDYKSNLQEYTQAEFGQVPVYRVVFTQGPSHQKTFEVTVSLKGEVYGKGKGGTKKSAEQQAACQALEKLTS